MNIRQVIRGVEDVLLNNDMLTVKMEIEMVIMFAEIYEDNMSGIVAYSNKAG